LVAAAYFDSDADSSGSDSESGDDRKKKGQKKTKESDEDLDIDDIDKALEVALEKKKSKVSSIKLFLLPKIVTPSQFYKFVNNTFGDDFCQLFN
jgi:hypothetical protein